MKKNIMFDATTWAENLLGNKMLKPNMTAEQIYDVLRDEDEELEKYMKTNAGQNFCFDLLGSLEENGYSVKY